MWKRLEQIFPVADEKLNKDTDMCRCENVAGS
jgi:hypothetical protein